MMRDINAHLVHLPTTVFPAAADALLWLLCAPFYALGWLVGALVRCVLWAVAAMIAGYQQGRGL